jgi:uncharacterized protein
VDKGHSYTVRALVELGANVSTINLGGWTPLMMAAAKGDLETLAILLNGGADVLPCNRWGMTALSEARQCVRATTAVEMLMRAGAIN